MIEIASLVQENPRRIVDWANTVRYNGKMNEEDRDITAQMDAWIKEVGKTGLDRDHEISQLVTQTFTPDAMMIPSDLIDTAFDQGSIGEFDDAKVEVAPKNTLHVHDGALGGNVDASYIDAAYVDPTWSHLQVETYIPLVDLRRGGYKTVANLLNMIEEAFEAKRIAAVVSALNGAITSGAPNYIAEATSAPTEASASALALYLADYADGGEKVIFSRNQYIHAINLLTGSTTFATDETKNMYNHDGFIRWYQGCRLFGVPGRNILPDGTVYMPDKIVLGVAGKVGRVITRGDVQVLQNTDINSETLHLKVNGYQFGVAITDVEKAAKIVLS